MQVSSNSDGIQKLLAAEQEAQRIVAEARKGKQERLRQAKAEAEKEIAAYKAEREGAYQKKVSESTSGASATFQRLSAETSGSIKKIQDDVAQKKHKVVDMLLQYGTHVKF